MKYIGMPAGMWVLFRRSFQRNLTAVLGYDKAVAKDTTLKAKKKYKEIIMSLPTFERGDIFLMNIVNCAMLSAFCLSFPDSTFSATNPAMFTGSLALPKGGA